MSQIEVNTNINNVIIQDIVNTVDVNIDNNGIITVPQEITKVVQILVPGPPGRVGASGSFDSGSYLETGSFNQFTSSYYIDSASFSSSITLLSSSFISFSASYNTGSFTGSFFGNGSGLVGVVSSSYTVNSSTASYVTPLVQNVEITGSLYITNSLGIFVEEPGIISGSIFGIGNVTSYSASVNNRLYTLETTIDGGFY